MIDFIGHQIGTPSAGGGGANPAWTLLSSTTISGSPNSIELDSTVFNGDYDVYRIVYTDIVFGAADGDIVLTISSNDGVSYLAGTSYDSDTEGFVVSAGAQDQAYFRHKNSSNEGAHTSGGFNGYLDIYFMHDTDAFTMLESYVTFKRQAASGVDILMKIFGIIKSASNFNNIKLDADVGATNTFASGKLTVYGMTYGA